MEARRNDIRSFFTDPQHWVYVSRGTPSLITPRSVYHVTQLEVLFEDKHFHFLTTPIVTELRNSGFLAHREVSVAATRAIVIWRKAAHRYVEREIKQHLQLMSEYSTEAMSKATGGYAETLALMGFSRLHMNMIDRNTRSYQGKTWTATEHDLDFIMEKEGRGYGVEIKNTHDYFPRDELNIKLEMCKCLGLRPLFIVRNRHSGQYYQVQEAGGLLYVFKTKIFPPGQEALVRRVWMEMRLPVQVWHDWPPQFYQTIGHFLASQ